MAESAEWEEEPRRSGDPEPLSGTALARAAAFLAQEPRFIGYWLLRWSEHREGGFPPIAQRLRCDLQSTHTLALCTMPPQDRFEPEVQRLAERFGLPMDDLADLLLEAQFMESISGDIAGNPSKAPALGQLPAFAAARDREHSYDQDAVRTETELPSGPDPSRGNEDATGLG